MRIVDVLNTEAFNLVAYKEGNFDLTGIKDPATLVKAIKTITSEDISIFTDSNLLMTNVPTVLDMALSKAGLKDVVTIPVGTDWNSELMRIVDVLNTEAFNLVAYKEGHFDLTGIKDPATLVEAIKTITSEDISIFTDSNLVMSNIGMVLDMVLAQSGLKDVVTIPAGTDWNSELIRIVDVLNTEAFNLIAYKEGKFD